MIVNPHIIHTLIQSTIYSENFQSGAAVIIPNYKFPVNWTSPGSPYVSLNEWTVFSDGGIVVPASSGSGGKCVLFANNGFAVNRITAKPFSTIGFKNITVDLLQYRIILSPAMTIEWSSDNSTWTNTGFTNVTADGAWHTATTINLPVGAEGKANIYLRFTITADDTGVLNTLSAFDDLLVKGYS